LVFFNYTTMQVTAKIVFYGPGLCGKTTNLQFIHHKTAQGTRGEMVSLETEADRTLFFDLLPLDVGVIGGMKVRLQLYTVPGQVFYNATRKLVLKGVDGVVFVADSQAPMLEANAESLRNLDENLRELGAEAENVPIVLQYNKRDLRNILTVEELQKGLNARGAPYFEAAARHGIGVFETLKAISRLALLSIRKKLAAEDAARKPSPPKAVAVPLAPVPAPPAQATPEAAPAAAAAVPRKAPVRASDDPLGALVGDVPLVEFAEEDTDKHVRAVPTKGDTDIHRELAGLRTMAAESSGRAPTVKASGGATKDVERRLQDMLATDKDSKQEVRRKVSVEVPGRLLRGAAAMSVQLVFDQPGREPASYEAVSIKLVGNKKLGRLTLHLEVDVKGD
jgi:small GTP-binding protein